MSWHHLRDIDIYYWINKIHRKASRPINHINFVLGILCTIAHEDKYLFNYDKEQAYGDYIEDPMQPSLFRNAFESIIQTMLDILWVPRSFPSFTRHTRSYTYNTALPKVHKSFIMWISESQRTALPLGGTRVCCMYSSDKAFHFISS